VSTACPACNEFEVFPGDTYCVGCMYFGFGDPHGRRGKQACSPSIPDEFWHRGWRRAPSRGWFEAPNGSWHDNPPWLHEDDPLGRFRQRLRRRAGR
jgi:hypothetical protein